MSEKKLWSNPYSLLIKEPGGKIVEASFGLAEDNEPLTMLTIWEGEPGEGGHSIVTVHLYAKALMEILKEGWEHAEKPPDHWDELCADDQEFEDENEGSTH